eukprot:scaffold132_cov170-Amphora_coffeaeformis.AAC.35
MDFQRMEDDTANGPPHSGQGLMQELPNLDDRNQRSVKLSENNDPTLQSTPLEVALSLNNQLSAIRLALGLLLAVLVLAALATVFAAKKYRHVVMVFWIILIVAYMGLASLLQNMLQRDEFILTPALRRAVDAVTREHYNFMQDWRDHVLFLKNDAEPRVFDDPNTERIPPSGPEVYPKQKSHGDDGEIKDSSNTTDTSGANKGMSLYKCETEYPCIHQLAPTRLGAEQSCICRNCNNTRMIQ